MEIKWRSHQKEYYEEQAIKKYNNKDKWKDIFIEIELSKNPLFDRKKYIYSLNEQEKRNQRIAYMKAHPEKFEPRTPPQKPKQTIQNNKPKCPTCGSTNIQKISDLNRGIHALAFGLFSKTAKSQFQCLNCNYKW